MDVDDPVDERTGSSSTPVRTVSLSAYVDLPIAEVHACFADPAVDDLLTSVVQVALGGSGDALVSAHALPSVWVSSGNARVSVTWRVQDPGGQASEGTATISLLVVQSGHDAITELLVSLPVSDDSVAAATAATHRILDELTRRLEGSGP